MTNQSIGPYIGLFFSAMTVVALLWLHLSSPVTPRIVDSWETAPSVVVCDTAPAWVTDKLPSVLEELAELGIDFGNVEELPCSPCKTLNGERSVSCVEGAIAIDLMGQWFEDDHVGETTIRNAEGQQSPAWVAIQLPTLIDGEDLPPDVERLVLAHELVHALGYGHTVTQLPGPFVGVQTGNLMNPSAAKIGWNVAGLE